LNLRSRYRELLILGALVWGASLAAITGGRLELVDGFLYDIAIALTRPLRPETPPRAIVVAVDENSMSSETLESVPRVFFGPYYAKLLDGLIDGGATAVGFDVALGYAASRFAPMERSYDDAMLASLARNREHVVLARTETMLVALPYVAAVIDPRDPGREDPEAIAYAELVPSEDGVQRWVYTHFKGSDGATLPTLAGRLAQIAGGSKQAAPFLLAPTGLLESRPTYALADMLKCIETDPQSVRSAVAGKVVLIGGNLPDEDRKRASDRFLRVREPQTATVPGGCQLTSLGPSAPLRNGYPESVPGVHIHAAAVDALLGGTGVTIVPASVRMATAILAALLCAGLGLFLRPGVAVGVFVAFAVLLFAGSAAVLIGGQWLPLAVPALAAMFALIGGQITRYFAQDRRRRRLEAAFGSYLAPTIVRKLADAESDVALGGEEREITVMFADLSNFTGVSDTMAPAELMELTNRYFKVIVDVIDRMGGYVDKFIGDSVMAIFGAPVSMPDAAEKALLSARAIQESVQQLKAARAGADLAQFNVKIGISTGRAIVGNVGAPRRLSYTALGATVNLAARLEKVCGTFNCPIVVDAATMEALRDRYLFCEIDAVSLKGKRLPVPVYEAIAPLATASDAQRDYVARYQSALTCYRGGDRERAATLWGELAAAASGEASAATVMAERARNGDPVIGARAARA
jgi:adenylate cyclase